jgi:hypothetical protein
VRISLAALAVATAVLHGQPQPLPPAGDGDIRVVYQELRDQTELLLTILPQASGGAPPPSRMTLTFSRVSSGRAPQGLATSGAIIDVRAYPGTSVESQAELSFDVDGYRVDLSGRAAPDYLSAFTTVRMLERIGAGDHVAASALGVRFELTSDQRAAVRAFVARVKSSDPAKAK